MNHADRSDVAEIRRLRLILIRVLLADHSEALFFPQARNHRHTFGAANGQREGRPWKERSFAHGENWQLFQSGKGLQLYRVYECGSHLGLFEVQSPC